MDEDVQVILSHMFVSFHSERAWSDLTAHEKLLNVSHECSKLKVNIKQRASDQHKLAVKMLWLCFLYLFFIFLCLSANYICS